MQRNLKAKNKNSKLVSDLLDWFTLNARDLPWRRTRDPYAIWVSEIMLQQTQVKTVIPYWERWMCELPDVESVASASPDKIHKLWEGLGYYTRARNLQKAAQKIVECGLRIADCGNIVTARGYAPDTSAGTGRPTFKCGVRNAECGNGSSGSRVRSPHRQDKSRNVVCQFPEKFEEVLALPGIGRYTAGAICSIAFNQPTPILDGNVIRVLTRVFGIGENPKEKETNELLWQIAEDLVCRAKAAKETKGITSSIPRPLTSPLPSPLPSDGSGEGTASGSKSFHGNLQEFVKFRASMRGYPGEFSSNSNSCSHLNQSLMELGALVCTPQNPLCQSCPARKLCVAFRENRVEQLPNLGERQKTTARRFVAFIAESDGRFLVRQRPTGVVNAHLWEFPNVEVIKGNLNPKSIAKEIFGTEPNEVKPLSTIKHSITRYRITLESYRVWFRKRPNPAGGAWKSRTQMGRLAFAAAHKKLASLATNSNLKG
jgi:adenine-specific DNA glycosylase